MRYVLSIAIVFVASGCLLKSRRVEPGEMDRVYKTDASVWAQTKPKTLTANDRQLPYRYEMLYEPSSVWSVISLHESFQKLPETKDKIEFRISQQHANAMAVLLRRLSGYVDKLSAVFDEIGRRGAEREWAELTADLLLEMDALQSAMSPSLERRRQSAGLDDSAAWVLVPLLQTMSSYAVDDAALVEGLPTDVQEERAAATVMGVLLRSSFRLSGRDLPIDLPLEVNRILRTAHSAEGAVPKSSLGGGRRDQLIHSLLTARAATPASYPALKRSAEKAGQTARALAGFMRFLAQMTAQWNRMDSVALEIRENDAGPVVGLEFNVRPGQVLDISDLHFAAPRVEFTGSGRVEVQQTDGQARVLFNSEGDGGMVIRFKGIVYGLASLVAFRLDDAYLREIRYSTSRSKDTGKIQTVEIMMEALKGDDRRRVIRVDTAKSAVLTERPGLPPRLDGRKKGTEFEYYNGRKVFRRVSVKTVKPELWGHKGAE